MRARGNRVRLYSAAARLLTLAVLFAAPLLGAAGAVQADVLVSNLGRSQDGYESLGNFADVAQEFTTGSHANGYTLSGIDIRFLRGWSTTPPTVTVHYGSPNGTLVATLTGPGSLAGAGAAASFSAPANTVLHPVTDYFVRLEGGEPGTTRERVRITGSKNEEPGGKTGWSIADTHGWRRYASTGDFRTFDGALMIRVNGTENASLTARHLKVTTAEDTAYTFGTSDFDFAGIGSTLTHATIVTLPYAGELKLNDTAATAGQSVPKTQITAGNLKFVPATNRHGMPHSGFTFKLSDGTATGVAGATAHTMGINVTPVNDPATGEPTISLTDGSTTAEVGKFLTVSRAGIEDVDGLPGTFGYQWIRVDGGTETDIAGGDRLTYRLTPDDAGKTFKVRVEFTDNGGGLEARTSGVFPQTGTVQMPSGSNQAPTASDGQVSLFQNGRYVFQAADFNFADADSADSLQSVKIVTVPSAGTLAFEGRPVKAGQWVSKSYIDRNLLAFTPEADETGTGYASFTFKVSDGTAASAAAYTMTIDVTVENHPATGKPTIVGTTEVGFTLRVSTADIADRNGLPDSFDYQWIRVDGVTETDISGATSDSYRTMGIIDILTDVGEDLGKKIKVKVSFTDKNGHAETVTSDAIGPLHLGTTSDTEVTVDEDTRYVFRVSDFGFSAPEDNYVEVVTRPFAGGLLYSTSGGFTKLTSDRFFAKSFIQSGGLVFDPAANGNGEPYTTVTYKLTIQNTASSAAASPKTYLTINVTPVNDAPTGRPAILGTPEIGLTLTASTRDIADADGMPAELEYRWIRVDGMNEADITGATSSTYTATPQDRGKTIKLSVSFTDGDGTAESLTSVATARVAASTRPTAANGTVTADEDTAYTFEAADFGFSGASAGDTLASVKIVTLPAAGTLERDGAAVTAGQSVTKADIDGDKMVFTPAANANGAAYAGFTFRVNDGTNESLSVYRMTIDVTPVNDAPAGQPAITGKVQVGHTLIADATGITDEDGLPLEFSYEWIRVDGGTEADISGATSRAYKLTTTDSGKTIKVKVSFTDEEGNSEAVTSSASASVATATGSTCNAPAFGTRTPVWTGTVTVQNVQNLIVGFSTGFGGGSLDNTKFRIGTVDYVVNDVYVFGSFAPIPGNLYFTTSPGLSTTFSSDGLELHVCDASHPYANAGQDDNNAATWVWSGSLDWSSFSERTVYLSVPANSPTPSNPRVSGVAEIGETLSASISHISDPNASVVRGARFDTAVYAWLRVDGETETVIPGATSRSYVVETEDAGKKLKFRLRFFDSVGYLEEVTSAAKEVANPFAPQFRSAVALGTTVTLTYDKALDADSVPAATAFAVTVDGEAATLATSDPVAVSGKTVTLTLVSAAGAGEAVTVKYTEPTGTDAKPLKDADGGKVPSDAAARSARTTAAAPGNFRVLADDGQVTLSWQAPAYTGNSPVSGYEFRYAQGESVASSVSWSSTGTALTHTLTGLTNGEAYGFEVRALNGVGNGAAADATATPMAGACNAPDFVGAQRNSIWTGTLTVGTDVIEDSVLDEVTGTRTDETVAYGFKDGGAGALSSKSFMVGDDSYAIGEVYLFAFEAEDLSIITGYRADDLLVSMEKKLTDADKAQLVLHVCAASFALSEARYEKYGETQHDYAWFDTGLNWSSVTERTLYLSLPLALAPQAATVADPPTVSGTPAVSASGDDGEWAPGETVEVTLTFSEAVTVDTAGGTPSVGISLGGTQARNALYLRGSGTTELVFGYTLANGDGSHSSMFVTPDSLTLNDGTIRSTASNVDAMLGHVGAVVQGRQVNSGRGTRGDDADPFSARFLDLPAHHDGATAFTFELRFSAHTGMSHRDVRDTMLEVSGAQVTGARRLDPNAADRNRRWEVTIEPSQAGDVTITLPARGCTEANAVCAGGRTLARAVSATVPAKPFTGSFANVPEEHDGTSAFTLEFHLSEAPRGLGYETVRDHLFDASGGTIDRARRIGPVRNQGWELTVSPSGNGDVTLALLATESCDDDHAVCTAEGRMLRGGPQATVKGPATLSVADAQVEEAEGATLDFVVTLSRKRSSDATVNYATSDGTATAGSDYTAASGTLTIAAGKTSKTVSVAVLNDAHDEDSETLTFTLSSPVGAVLDDDGDEATGTITNDDPMPGAWIARFGRTVGTQVVEAIGARLDGTPSSHFTVGGVSLGGPTPPLEAEPLTPQDWLAEQLAHGPDARTPEERIVTGQDLLLGSSFHLASQDDAGRRGPLLSAWGRVVTGGFRTEVDGVTMDGDVTTGFLGFDAEWERLLAGVLLSRSEGDGAYSQGDGDGRMESALTGVYPYARLLLGARVSLWGVVGAGSGDLRLSWHDDVMDTGLALQLGAIGVTGSLLEGGAVDLSVKSDALWVRTESDAAAGLSAASTRVSRVRLTVEGGRTLSLSASSTLTPTLEVGVRHDGGDAETGTGVEVGAGVVYRSGIVEVQAQVRRLVAHEAEGYEEWGAGGSLRVSARRLGPGSVGGADAVVGHAGGGRSAVVVAAGRIVPGSRRRVGIACSGARGRGGGLGPACASGSRGADAIRAAGIG